MSGGQNSSEVKGGRDVVEVVRLARPAARCERARLTGIGRRRARAGSADGIEEAGMKIKGQSIGLGVVDRDTFVLSFVWRIISRGGVGLDRLPSFLALASPRSRGAAERASL